MTSPLSKAAGRGAATRRATRPLLAAVALLGLYIAPAPATAADLALTPLVDNGADAKRLKNIFQLMSSELEFMSSVDTLIEVDPPPSSLNAGCVTSDACLGGIASSKGANAVLTGVLTEAGDQMTMDLVYWEGGRTQRRQAFTVPMGATALANQMTDILNQMLTGVSNEDKQEAAPSAAAFDSALGDDDDFQLGPTPEELARQQAAARAQAEAQARAAAEAQVRAQQQAQARAAAEAQARAAAAAQARAQAEAQARAQAEAQARAQAQAQAAAQAQAQREAAAAAAAAAAAEAQRRAEEEARRRAEEEARRRAQEEARRSAEQAARARADAEARARAEEEARRQAALAAAAAAARTPAPAPTPQPVAPEPTISFASGSDQMTAEDIDSMIQFGAPSGDTPTPAPTYEAPAPAPTYVAPAPAPTYVAPAPTPTYVPPAPSPTYTSPAPAPLPEPAYTTPAPVYGTPYSGGPTNNDLLLEEQELAEPILDLDADDKGNRKNRGSNSSSSATLERATPKTMQISLRGGYSNYGSFNFVTAGGELGLALSKGLMLVAGVESYSVRRQNPSGGPPQWANIYPINVGGLYKIRASEVVVPYVGADAIFVQYYSDDVGADWAGGARVRLGVDFMVHSNFGLNLNAAVGAWTGKTWSALQPGLKNTGLLPQINAGIVLAF